VLAGVVALAEQVADEDDHTLAVDLDAVSWAT